MGIQARDLVYGSAGGLELAATAYLPAAGDLGSVLVDVHGGAWTSGDRFNNAYLDGLLAERGHLVLAIDFRHGPALRHPSALQDITAAVRFVRHHAARLGVDADRIGLLGTSSGGHLALLAAIQPNHAAHHGTSVAGLDGDPAPPGEVDAAVTHVSALWPVSDPLRRYRYAQESGRPELAERHLQYFADEQAMRGAAIQAVLRGGGAERLPAAYVVQPGADLNVPVPMTMDLVDAYQSAGGALEYAFYPGLPHAFSREETAETRALAAGIDAFVRRRISLAPAAAPAPA
ncbi:MAG: alpha/beta hydrolase [Chloroflexi bacterium]|nr:alpha/beta hydrolase [Chloroflexota bacterium]